MESIREGTGCSAKETQKEGRRWCTKGLPRSKGIVGPLPCSSGTTFFRRVVRRKIVFTIDALVVSCTVQNLSFGNQRSQQSIWKTQLMDWLVPSYHINLTIVQDEDKYDNFKLQHSFVFDETYPHPQQNVFLTFKHLHSIISISVAFSINSLINRSYAYYSCLLPVSYHPWLLLLASQFGKTPSESSKLRFVGAGNSPSSSSNW